MVGLVSGLLNIHIIQFIVYALANNNEFQFRIKLPFTEEMNGQTLQRVCKCSVGSINCIFVSLDLILLAVSIWQIQAHECSQNNMGFITIWLVADNILNITGKLSMVSGLFYGKSMEKQIARQTIFQMYGNFKNNFAMLLENFDK